MQRIREFFRTSAGKTLAILLTLGALVLAIVMLVRTVGPTEAGAMSSGRWFIDAENGKPFRLELQIGMKIPVVSPFSGKNTGYEAERCYWTKDGKPKGPNDEPTLVLLNKYRGKDGPTFCPDCGRLVTALNPVAEATGRPPPTEQEYNARNARRSGG